MKLNKIIILLAIILLILVVLIMTKCNNSQIVKTVNCSDGDSLARTVADSYRGTRIIVTGNCKENKPVAITRDGIIIDGKGSAVIDGKGKNRPVLTIKGAQDVIINGLTVKNGRQGIVAGLGSKVILKDVTVTENSRNGIVLSKAAKLPNDKENPQIDQQGPKKDGAPLSLESFSIPFIKDAVASPYPCSCTDTALSGGGSSSQCTAGLEIDTMVVCGTVSSTDNGAVGIYTLSASLITSGRLILERNEYVGLYAFDSSTITIPAEGSITAGNNSGIGILIDDSAVLIEGELLTTGNGQEELAVNDAEVICKKLSGDTYLETNDNQGSQCGQ